MSRPSLVPGLCLAVLLSFGARAFAQTDLQTRDEMARRASLLCPGFSNDRGLPGIRAVDVDALRVLMEHKYTICPDRRITDPIGAIWNSRWGVLLWNPANPKSIAVMGMEAIRMTRAMEFPNELMVYDLGGKALRGQVVPEFAPRDTFTSF